MDSLKVKLPHPARFALHKLLIMGRRQQTEKQEKDKQSAIRILNALIKTDQSLSIKEAFLAMPTKWQNKIKKQLADIPETEIVEVLQ